MCRQFPENGAWLQQSELYCFKISRLTKGSISLYFHGNNLHLTERKGAAVEEGSERGGVPVGSRWCVCLLNASTCSVSVDLWPCHRQPGSPTGRGSGGIVEPCTAGQLVLLSPAWKGELPTDTQAYSVLTCTRRSHMPNQQRCQGAGQLCRHPHACLTQEWGETVW